MQGQELGFFGWLIKEAAPKKGGFFSKQTAVNSLILKKGKPRCVNYENYHIIKRTKPVHLNQT